MKNGKNERVKTKRWERSSGAEVVATVVAKPLSARVSSPSARNLLISQDREGHFTKAKSSRLVKTCSFFLWGSRRRLVGLQEIRYKCSLHFCNGFWMFYKSAGKGEGKGVQLLLSLVASFCT